MDWKELSVSELKKMHEKETARAKRAVSKRDRAVAHSKADYIMRELIIRYEASWGLEGTDLR